MFPISTLSGSIHTGRRTLALVIAALIALAIAASSLTLAPRASAQAVRGNASDAATCEYGGYTYNVGDRISVFNGATYDNYYCGEDGYWHLVEQVVKPGPVKPPTTTNRDFVAKRSR